MNALVLLLVINLLAFAALGAWLLRLRAELARLRAHAAVEPGVPVPEELHALARQGQTLLLIRVLNPMDLAAQRHWLAGVAGRITPGIVRRVVAHEAARLVRLELPKFGVEAEVEVVGRG